MKRFLKAISFISFLLFITAACSGQKKQEKKPNIIFIMADDLGWQDVGFMGSKWFETPNLDKLAAESLVFINAYMYPTCSPSRAALLTGKQSFRTKVYNVPVLERGDSQQNIFSRWTVGMEHTMYSEPLKEAGYQLIHLGKWHLVGPNPEEETNYPFETPLKQPANGSLDWLPKHKSAEIQQYYPTGRGLNKNMSVAWFTSGDINEPFEFCGNIGQGHSDPDIIFAEGKFYLLTQMGTDYISDGPWVETVEVRMGVDTKNDGVINQWSDGQVVSEKYDYIEGFAKQIRKTPAKMEFLDLPEAYGFKFEVKVTEKTENESKPILDKVVVLFKN